MGLLFWKNNKDIDLFAQGVADDLFSHINPEAARDFTSGATKATKKQKIKVEKKLSDVVLQIQRFSKEHSLGVYGKARLQQTFNERLNELGYSPEVVNKLAESILLRNL